MEHRVQKPRNNTIWRRTVLCVLSFILVGALGVIPQALAEFEPSVLGVGRIQSISPADSPVSTQERFVPEATMTPGTSGINQLTTPLEREIPVANYGRDVYGVVANSPIGVWQTGYASAYGPSNAGRWTASGTELTDDSLGVAVDISWGYQLGRTVQVSYGTVTITTTIVDTGMMFAHGRVLDLQPGVWKAFGFSDEYDWGVRLVDWRFVD